MDYRYLNSPVGDLLLAGENECLIYVASTSGKGEVTPGRDWISKPDGFQDAATQLDEYFRGERRRFELAMAPHGTPFQLQVLDALTRIPYGETRSYRDIAVGIGKPKAVRAVGAANGRNPLSIVIPCHRVIGANGSLTGFGGGLGAKRFLLDLESGKQARLSPTLGVDG